MAYNENDYYNNQNYYGNGGNPYQNNQGYGYSQQDYQNAYQQGYGNQNQNPYNQGYGYQYAGTPAPAPAKNNTAKTAIISAAAVILAAIIAITSVVIFNYNNKKPENYTPNQIEALIIADMDKRIPDEAPEFAHELIKHLNIKCKEMIREGDYYRIPCYVTSPYMRDKVRNYTYNNINLTEENVTNYITENIDNSADYTVRADLTYDPENGSIKYNDEFINAISGYSWDIIQQYYEDIINQSPNAGIDIDEFDPPKREKNKDDSDDNESKPSKDNESKDNDSKDDENGNNNSNDENDNDGEEEECDGDGPDYSLYNDYLDDLESTHGTIKKETLGENTVVTGLCYAERVDLDNDNIDELVCAYYISYGENSEYGYEIEVATIKDSQVEVSSSITALVLEGEPFMVAHNGNEFYSGGYFGDADYTLYEYNDGDFVVKETQLSQIGSCEKVSLGANNFDSLKSSISNVRSGLN